MLELSKWDLDIETNDKDEYTSLVRAVRRTHQRFKLLFVSCSPSQGEKIRSDLMSDIPAKKYETLDIRESIDNLYEAINNIPNLSELDVLFIRGLEYSIFEYEDREFGDISKRSQSKVYGGSWAGVPPVLAKLNMQRELFRDRFPHICFVFLLPHFAIDYFIRRAPDFYDWKSGIYRFKTDVEYLQIQISKLEDYEEYNNLSEEEILAKIIEIRSCLDEAIDLEARLKLLAILASLYEACNRYLPALNTYSDIVNINPYNEMGWLLQGIILAHLGRYEESLASYDRAAEINLANGGIDGRYVTALPGFDSLNCYNHGVVLYNLGRYEDAINSYDLAIQLNPLYYSAYFNKATVLFEMKKYQDAIDNYNKAIEIQYNDHKSWSNKATAFFNLKRYNDAIESYNKAIEIQPDDYKSWNNKGNVLSELGQYQEALASYDRAIKLNSSDYPAAWFNRGRLFSDVGRYEEAMSSYDRAIQMNPNFHEAWHSKGFAFYKWGKYQEALTAYQKAITIKLDKYVSWHDKGLVLFHIGNYAEALTAWQQAFNIISKLKPSDTSDLIQEFLDEQLLPKFQQPTVRDILPQILTIYTTAQVLPELGVALTHNLKAIQSPTISDYTATEWLKMWQELGKPHPELALALRMLEAGVKYKRNPTDDRVFLSLPQEMCPLLREALGLKP